MPFETVFTSQDLQKSADILEQLQLKRVSDALGLAEDTIRLQPNHDTRVADTLAFARGMLEPVTFPIAPFGDLEQSRGLDYGALPAFLTSTVRQTPIGLATLVPSVQRSVTDLTGKHPVASAMGALFGTIGMYTKFWRPLAARFVTSLGGRFGLAATAASLLNPATAVSTATVRAAFLATEVLAGLGITLYSNLVNRRPEEKFLSKDMWASLLFGAGIDLAFASRGYRQLAPLVQELNKGGRGAIAAAWNILSMIGTPEEIKKIPKEFYNERTLNAVLDMIDSSLSAQGAGSARVNDLLMALPAGSRKDFPRRIRGILSEDFWLSDSLLKSINRSKLIDLVPTAANYNYPGNVVVHVAEGKRITPAMIAQIPNEVMMSVIQEIPRVITPKEKTALFETFRGLKAISSAMAEVKIPGIQLPKDMTRLARQKMHELFDALDVGDTLVFSRQIDKVAAREATEKAANDISQRIAALKGAAAEVKEINRTASDILVSVDPRGLRIKDIEDAWEDAMNHMFPGAISGVKVSSLPDGLRVRISVKTPADTKKIAASLAGGMLRTEGPATLASIAENRMVQIAKEVRSIGVPFTVIGEKGIGTRRVLTLLSRSGEIVRIGPDEFVDFMDTATRIGKEERTNWLILPGEEHLEKLAEWISEQPFGRSRELGEIRTVYDLLKQPAKAFVSFDEALKGRDRFSAFIKTGNLKEGWEIIPPALQQTPSGKFKAVPRAAIIDFKKAWKEIGVDDDYIKRMKSFWSEASDFVKPIANDESGPAAHGVVRGSPAAANANKFSGVTVEEEQRIMADAAAAPAATEAKTGEIIDASIPERADVAERERLGQFRLREELKNEAWNNIITNKPLQKIVHSLAMLYNSFFGMPATMEYLPVTSRMRKEFVAALIRFNQEAQRYWGQVINALKLIPDTEWAALADSLDRGLSSVDVRFRSKREFVEAHRILRAMLDDLGSKVPDDLNPGQTLGPGKRWIAEYFPRMRKLRVYDEATREIEEADMFTGTKDEPLDFFTEMFMFDKMSSKVNAWFLNPRTGNLKEVEKDIPTVMKAYIVAALRKIHYEPLLIKYKDDVNALANSSDPLLASIGRYAVDYANMAMGKPTAAERVMAKATNEIFGEMVKAIPSLESSLAKANVTPEKALTRLVANMNFFQVLSKLGGKGSFALMNMTQALMPWVEYGSVPFFKAMKLVTQDLARNGTKSELANFLREAGIFTTSGQALFEMQGLGMSLAVHRYQKAMGKLTNVLMAMSVSTESANRAISYLTGFISRLSEMGVNVRNLDEFLSLIKKPDGSLRFDGIRETIRLDQALSQLDSLLAESHLEGVRSVAMTQFIYGKPESPRILHAHPFIRSAMLFKTFSLHQLANLGRYVSEAVRGDASKLARFVIANSAVWSIPIAVGLDPSRSFTLLEFPDFGARYATTEIQRMVGLFGPSVQEPFSVVADFADYVRALNAPDKDTPSYNRRLARTIDKLTKTLTINMPGGVAAFHMKKALEMVANDYRAFDFEGRPLFSMTPARTFLMSLSLEPPPSAWRKSEIVRRWRQAMASGDVQKANSIRETYNIADDKFNVKTYVSRQYDRVSEGLLEDLFDPLSTFLWSPEFIWNRITGGKNAKAKKS